MRFYKKGLNGLLAGALLLLAACARHYKAPSLSGNPAAMSADALCYRQAYARNNAEIDAEITARRLDCAAILDVPSPAGAF